MFNREDILLKIKKSINSTVPDARIILYGSFARREEKPESDIDILILLEKEKVTWLDEKKVKYPLYDIEFDTGKIISPLVLSKKDWEVKHSITPFYEMVNKEGLIL